MVSHKFLKYCSISEKYVIGILIGILLNLQIGFCTMEIVMILILLVHEHSICYHLFVSFLISFFRVV